MELYAVSRAGYQISSRYHEQPSVRYLQRLTASVKKLDDIQFFSQIFDNVKQDQRICVILFDEIYVKKMLSFHGSEIFGYALNQDEIQQRKERNAKKALNQAANSEKKSEKAKKKSEKATKKEAKSVEKSEKANEGNSTECKKRKGNDAKRENFD